MDWVIRAGLIELALGALLGWAMVVREERPEWLKRIGVVAPARIRQVHLDYVMMGLILIGEGVETEAELETLLGLGIRYIQGFVIARPEFEILPRYAPPSGIGAVRAAG